MEEKTIQKIQVQPLALMMGVIGASLGLIFGILYASMMGSILSSLPSSSGIEEMGGFGLILAGVMVVIMPIMGFIGGLIEGALIALIYNFFAPRIGGVKVFFKEENSVPPQPPVLNENSTV